MKALHFLTCLVLSAAIFVSCDKNTTPPTPPVEPEEILPNDTQPVRLKTLVAQGLPSPYFHFQYNDSAYVTDVSFAKGFHQYTVAYKNGRLHKMVNIKSGDTLVYQYVAGRVLAVRQHTLLNTRRISYTLTYNERGKLASMEWFSFKQANQNDSLPERKVLLQYHEDGNLSQKDEYWPDASGKLTWTGSETYNNYDQGTNVDDFLLLKDSFDEFVFLPQVKLQKSNPATVVSKGIINDSRITYTYNYVNGLPTEKKGRMEFTRGGDSGKVFNLTDRFAY